MSFGPSAQQAANWPCHGGSEEGLVDVMCSRTVSQTCKDDFPKARVSKCKDEKVCNQISSAIIKVFFTVEHYMMKCGTPGFDHNNIYYRFDVLDELKNSRKDG